MRILTWGLTVLVGYGLLFQLGRELQEKIETVEVHDLDRVEQERINGTEYWRFWFVEEGSRISWVRTDSPNWKIQPEEEVAKVLVTWQTQRYPPWWPTFLRGNNPKWFVGADLRGSRQALESHIPYTRR
jgi:hypothetical protein